MPKIENTETKISGEAFAYIHALKGEVLREFWIKKRIKMMRYIKISASGEQLPDDATEWAAVLDTQTDLMWQKNRCIGRYGWREIREAVNFINKQAPGGFADWRMPKKKELKSLIIKNDSPTIDARYFPKVTGSSFWTSSTHAYFADVAWMIDFYDGREDYYSKSVALFVLLVRNNLLTAS